MSGCRRRGRTCLLLLHLDVRPPHFNLGNHLFSGRQIVELNLSHNSSTAFSIRLTVSISLRGESTFLTSHWFTKNCLTSQEEEEELVRAPAAPVGKPRTEVLREDISNFGRHIAEIVVKLANLDEEKGDAKIKRLNALLAELEAQQAIAMAELRGLLTGVFEIPQGSVQRGFPAQIAQNLPKMLFAVLDKNGPNHGDPIPVGVAFFVRDDLAVTAFHVLGTHYKIGNTAIDDGLTVHLAREAGLSPGPNAADPFNFFEMQLVKHHVDEDWALMKLRNPTRNISPFVIGSTKEAEWEDLQLLSFNIALASYATAEDTHFPHIIHTRASHRDRGRRTFIYDCMAHEGDSGGAVIISKSGQVVAMHCEFVNAMQADEEAAKKTLKLQVSDVRSEVSSGRSHRAKEGIRLDYLQQQGIFNEAY